MKIVEITIPVLDEERELKPNVLKLLALLESEVFYKDYDWKLVIADNGSTDKTPEIVRELVAAHPARVGFIRLERRGVGLALKTSWARSKADIVGFFDLDLSTDLKHLPQAIEAIAKQDFDIVYGTRLHKGSKVIGRALKREITSRIFNLLLRIYLRAGFSDAQCGFKFFKRSVLDTLARGGAVSDGWFYLTEMLVSAQWSGLRMFELPVIWTDSPDSRVEIIPLALEYLKAMRELKQRRPQE